MDNFIYDFETLSINKVNGVVVNLAALEYDSTRFKSNPYEFSELVNNCKIIKFDVKDQMKNGRTTEASVLDWWKSLPKEVSNQILPSSEDRPISELRDWLTSNYDFNSFKNVFTRGNTFDPIFLEYIFKQFDQQEVHPHWKIRDTRSYLDGLLHGTGLNDKFMPSELDIEFRHHDPAHDIALDVMRMQTILKNLP